MAADVAVKVHGLDHLKRQLAALPKAMRKRVLRNALSAGARLVRDEAKRNAPVLSPKAAMKAPFRAPGTVKKAIRVRTSKRDRRDGNVGVFVNVKPAGKGQKGAKSRTDPFYWRWQEFGWTPATGPRKGAAGLQARRLRRKNSKSSAPAVPGRQFLASGAKRLGQALQVFEKQVGVWVSRVSATGTVTE